MICIFYFLKFELIQMKAPCDHKKVKQNITIWTQLLTRIRFKFVTSSWNPKFRQKKEGRFLARSRRIWILISWTWKPVDFFPIRVSTMILKKTCHVFSDLVADRIWWIDRFRSSSDVTDIWGSPVFQSPFVSHRMPLVYVDFKKDIFPLELHLAIRCLAKSQRWLWHDPIPEGPTSHVFFHVGSGFWRSLKLMKIFDKTAETSTGNWKIFHLIFNLATRNSSNLQLFYLCPDVYLSSTRLNGAVETGNWWGSRHQVSRRYNLSDGKTPRFPWSWDVTFFQPLGGWSWKFHQKIPSRHWNRQSNLPTIFPHCILFGQRDLPHRKCQSIFDLVDVLGLGLVGWATKKPWVLHRILASPVCLRMTCKGRVDWSPPKKSTQGGRFRVAGVKHWWSKCSSMYQQQNG